MQISFHTLILLFIEFDYQQRTLLAEPLTIARFILLQIHLGVLQTFSRDSNRFLVLRCVSLAVLASKDQQSPSFLCKLEGTNIIGESKHL